MLSQTQVIFGMLGIIFLILVFAVVVVLESGREKKRLLAALVSSNAQEYTQIVSHTQSKDSTILPDIDIFGQKEMETEEQDVYPVY